jgi:hypothetical protein
VERSLPKGAAPRFPGAFPGPGSEKVQVFQAQIWNELFETLAHKTAYFHGGPAGSGSFSYDAATWPRPEKVYLYGYIFIDFLWRWRYTKGKEWCR